MSNRCVINVGTDESGIYFQVCGYASFTEAAEISHYLRQLPVPTSSNNFKYAFDLSDCEKMDSTFMGLIARLACESNERKNVDVVHCRGSALKCLEDLGLTLIVNMCDTWPTGTLSLDPLGSQGLERRDKEEIIRKSHETLSSLSDENRKRFSDAINSFKSDRNQNY